MTALGPRRFAVVATAVALFALALVALVAPRVGGSGALVWGLAGWAATAPVGVAGGAWLVAWHGRPGSAFLIAMATCMLARLSLGGGGALAAALAARSGTAGAGMGPMLPYVAGLAAGYLPMQILESVWFYRRSRGVAPGAPSRA